MIPDLFIPYLVIVGISMVMSLFVTASIVRFGSKTISTKLVLHLHITLLIEEITCIPYAYTGNHGLCEFVGFVHLYAGMANSLVIFFMMVVYRYLFVEDTWQVSKFIIRRLLILIYITPLISALPFTTTSYGTVGSAWCDIQNSTDKSAIWATVLFFGWICAFIVLSALMFFFTVWRVYKTDPEMATKLASSIGQYSIISILTWLPRIVAREHTLDKEYANLVVYISGILYFLIFMRQKSALKLFEIFSQEQNIDLDGRGNSNVRASNYMFSWEEDEEDSTTRTKLKSVDRNSSWSLSSVESGKSGTALTHSSISNPLM